MSLQVLDFEYHADAPKPILADRGHFGVTGSGDMEVIMEKKELGGAVKVRVHTPVRGFDAVWKKVLERFVTENHLGNLSMEINDDNATPVVVSLRLCQALAEVNSEGSVRHVVME